ncbi:MAG: GntR family transcriptional regulator [Dysgonamonadaceae bacterium]|jgi:DNA-binding transcriptional regulator YhcF (GntR family)|nr:GntR family transcriptional regulator [Dysgonamonadaceae bacterium]
MEFKESQAIYLQIGHYICEQILLGKWKTDERILSVREMGAALEVNPNTVMRAYDFLQGKEIIFNKRGLGYFVADNARERIIAYRKTQFLKQELPFVFKNMQLLGMSFNELESEYNQYLQQHENKQ